MNYIGLISCVGLLAIPAWAGSSMKVNSKPNVLMIAIDDLNDWVGFMDGHPNTKTPHMDRLAAQGTIFMNAHTAAPHCGPSRTALMSGLRPSTTGIYAHVFDEDLEKTPAGQGIYLSNWFENNGYKTMGKGKIFHHWAPEGAFQEFDGTREAPRFGPKPEKRFTWDTIGTGTDWGVYPERDEDLPDFKTAEWAVERLKQKHDEPFFMAVGFVLPHVPWYAPQKWFDLHPLEEIETPPYLKGDQDDVPPMARKIAEMLHMPTADWAKESGEWKHIVQAYLATVSMVDHCVGMVLDELERSGYAENTVVVLWSDHGYHLGEKNRFAKQSLWERATRMPMIFTAPEFKGGQSTDGPASLMDLYPTLLELCGLPANPKNEGVSLVPLMRDPKAKWNHNAITTYGENNHAVRSQRYRYIRYEDGSEELYDCLKDPNEWKNLADNLEYEEIKKELAKSLPKINTPWSQHTYLRCNDYFTGKSPEVQK
ncbi:Choline-sulfatase [Pontiella desulfatans]|uniref:Choline-sulfatase n=2 Tax=Pontiella desulfatans TaxID=2750659 RepID=A0A6C2U3V6_PONDE|nr:sulfatase S1_7 [Kiritimatiellales bacterium]VGO14056.1 Choline-sulfatase [Pontiella desulfatans]